MNKSNQFINFYAFHTKGEWSKGLSNSKYYKLMLHTNYKTHALSLVKMIDDFIQDGAIYLGFHGKYTDMLEGAADNLIATNYDSNDNKTIMTLGYKTVSLEKALEEFVSMWPIDDYYDECNETLCFAFYNF